MALPPNFPQKQQRPINSTSFPEDLGEYFMSFKFEKSVSGITATGNTLSNLSRLLFSGGIRLPLPKKINDIQSVIYEPVSATSVMVDAGSQAISSLVRSTSAATLRGISATTQAASTLSPLGGYIAGAIVNPFLVMLFKQPTFKEFSFNWSFTPKNQNEANRLLQILDTIKKNMLPAQIFGGAILTYPNKVIISVSGGYFPTIMKFKPAVISGINIDYTGSGGLSFFEDGMPTVINLTMNVKEIEVWYNDESTASISSTALGVLGGGAFGALVGGISAGKRGALIGGTVGAVIGGIGGSIDDSRLNAISNFAARGQ